jgi:hypothetical protein
MAALLTFSSVSSAATFYCSPNHDSGGDYFSVRLEGTSNLAVQFSRDTYEGGFSLTDEPQGTRLTGDKVLKFDLADTNGCWPGSTFSANLVLRFPDFKTAFGWFDLYDVSGKNVFSGDVECKSDNSFISTNSYQEDFSMETKSDKSNQWIKQKYHDEEKMAPNLEEQHYCPDGTSWLPPRVCGGTSYSCC